MTVVDLYTIQIVRDDRALRDGFAFFNNVGLMMAEAEENLTDLLPAGYRARIRRWDNPDEEGTDDA